MSKLRIFVFENFLQSIPHLIQISLAPNSNYLPENYVSYRADRINQKIKIKKNIFSKKKSRNNFSPLERETRKPLPLKSA